MSAAAVATLPLKQQPQLLLLTTDWLLCSKNKRLHFNYDNDIIMQITNEDISNYDNDIMMQITNEDISNL